MKTYSTKPQEKKVHPVENRFSQDKSLRGSPLQFINNQAEGHLQQKMQEMADNSPQVAQLKSFQKITNNKLQNKSVPIQKTIQCVWIVNDEGNVVWLHKSNQAIEEEGYVRTEKKKGSQFIYAKKEKVEDDNAAKEREEAEQLEEYRRREAERQLPTTRRRDFSKKDKSRLSRIPKITTREDDNLRAKKGSFNNRGKAHLTDKGLHSAGKTPISATEQQDQDSVRKGRGNRISSKAPLPENKQVDNSQSYGGERISIKARKLERARLRGKPDAQNVNVKTTSEIQDELQKGNAISDTGKTRRELKAYASKDREVHHIVDFRSAEDPEHYIDNRFLILPDGTEQHDSDSESDSDSEEEVI
ncbi:hypothetical protein JYB64_09760 [Algoriphagus aestuarii]|nr:hypothetical protein [Algoriphagus aestuarii]